MLVYSWLNPHLELREREIGKGIFARQSIVAGDRLAIFGGYIMAAGDEPAFSSDQQDYALQIDETFVLGTRHEREIEDTDYFNHSCSPNAGFKGQIFLVAMRNIEAGEEITFDYAMALSKTQGAADYDFDCLCGSPDCRGRISEDDWKIPGLQRKYDGYFQWYLQDKIERMKIK